MSKLILVRHGQSVWNKLNLFTGWVDIPLSPQGIEEAFSAGRKIKDIPIDVIFTSSLIRAQMTAMLALSVHSTPKTPVILHPENTQLEAWGKIYSHETEKLTIPVITSSNLNERMYGELQGLNKAETAEKFGADQVKIWRRSYDIAPPNGESLKMTAERSIPYFNEVIVPRLQEGKNIFVSAHGNSLRSIIMHLDKLNTDEVLHLELATGEPIVYNYKNGLFQKEIL